MRFFRDESGQVLVFPGLLGARERTSAADRALERIAEAARAPQQVSVQQAVPQVRTAHCSFVCRWCQQSILLPHKNMGMVFGQPAVRQIQARSIATVCQACGHVADYTLFRACHGFDTQHKLVDAMTSGNTVLVDWLHCTEATCTARVPFYMPLERRLEEGEGRALEAKWMWEDVSCASGHPIEPLTLEIWGKG